MRKKRKKPKKPFVSPPGPGRNLALRPGGGPHVPEDEKRAAERVRREIDEQSEDA